MAWITDMSPDLRRALIGGAAAGFIALAGGWAIGRLSGAEARQLIEGTLPVARSLCSTVTLACATILALMLTLLGLSTDTGSKLKDSFYQRIRQIALVDVSVLVAAMLTFLVLNVPLLESDKVPTSWYSSIYYATLLVSCALGGLLISVVLLLYSTVENMIEILSGNTTNHRFLEDEAEDAQEEKQNG